MKELNSLEDIFNKRLFRIPDYQRGYAWRDEQLSAFWEDLMNLNKNRFHYTGVLSIKEIDREVWKDWNTEAWLIETRKHQPVHIVDGQQRLTTCTILIYCITKMIEKHPNYKNRDDSEIYLGSYSLKEIKRQYISISQPPNHTINTFKFGYEKDNPSFLFLKHKVFEEPSGGKIDETFYTLNLENAKKFFNDNLNDLYKKDGILGIENLFEKLVQRMMFNLYELGDDFDVFVAFETMNNRGKKLSDLELLKNRLIYLTTLYDDTVSNNDKVEVRKNINSAWKEIYYQLGRNKKRPLNDDDFLRAHWIMYFKYSRQKGNDYIKSLLDEEFAPKKVLTKIKVNKKSLSKVLEVKEENIEVEEEEEEEDFLESIEEIVEVEEARLSITTIDKYVKSLKDAAQHWYNTYNPEDNVDLTADESIYIDKLNRINISYFRPLVMSLFASGRFNVDERIKLLKKIERFIFLNFRLSRSMSNYKSSYYYNATRELYKGSLKIETLIDSLDEHSNYTFYENGDFYYSYFKDHITKKFSSNGIGYYAWNGLRYFLFEYEEYLKRHRNQPKISWKNFVRSTKDKVSIEHIYPQTPSNECWKPKFNDYSDYEINRFKGSLGNLLPLSASINSSLQNDCFKDKNVEKYDKDGTLIRNGYQNGSYSEQEVAKYNEWTPEAIMKRGLTLLKFMEDNWNISLGTIEDKLKILHLDFMNNEEEEETT
ncbi:MAG: hypothetical protein CL605_09460 [Altibacter sp.]|uniref:DUF262 domain-containing protein n=1 Tax=Altibacter sp. TaxID=2024823 RepID=UPI000C8CADAA|nr:DUF262 domain-containing HNH endonuclease family protein [Altibacter sp.]MAP55116.1 hypothetical protein [Altibacter sp.]